jgi:predicted anti-sigma-YlaC factor YlaD
MAMDCEGLIRYLSDYIDHDLDDELAEEAREHLRTCKNCRVVLDSTQQMILLYRQRGKRRIPAARQRALYDQIAQAFASRDNSQPDAEK